MGSSQLPPGRPTTPRWSRPQLRRLAALAKALGHPARIQILRFLSQRQGCMCGDLVELLPLAQSTVSQHLKVLKSAGLIRGEVDGPAFVIASSQPGWMT